MTDQAGEFLKKLGMQGGGDKPENMWERIIVRNSSYLIFGDVGAGKSGLAWYLLEDFSRKYDLLPAVVGFPRDKQHLIPDNYRILDTPDECTKIEDAIVFIDEADIQLPIEDTKARTYVTNFLSLPRQRHQILLLGFHFPRLVMGRYFPFFTAFLHKRPPYLIEFASKSKGDTLYQMMQKAEERFAELVPPDWKGEGQPEAVVKQTYVVAPRIRWQGMVANGLASFWTQQLSEVWAGVDIDRKPKHNRSMGHSPSPVTKKAATWLTPEPAPPEEPAIRELTDERGYLYSLLIVDPEGKMNASREAVKKAIKDKYGKRIQEQLLDDMSIAYEDYQATVTFPSKIPWTP